MTKIAVFNNKGGIGKTTTAINISSAFAKAGKKVLLVDCDPQHHLSKWLAYEPDGKPTITDLIFTTITSYGAQIDYNNFIRHNENEKIDYIPSTEVLAGMLGLMATQADSQNLLTKIFSNDFFNIYDYIVFDCQTSLDLLVTNVLKACDKLLIPVQADKLAYDAVPEIINTLIRIKNEPDIQKYILGFVITMYQKNTTHSKAVAQALKESYGDLVFDTYISYRTEAKNAYGYQQTSVSDKNSIIGKQYIEVAKAIMGA